MDFVTSEYYFYFLPIVFVLTMWIALGVRKYQISILMLMSYLFFWFASGWHLILLLISTCVDWTSGNKISLSNDEKVKKRWLKISLITNLTILGIFKYLDFFIESWNFFSLKIPISPEIDSLGLMLPVGISFYTFQTMSYTIDIFRDKSKKYDSFIDFACYAAFFPQLVAGPIVRADHFRKEIEKPIKIDSTKYLGISRAVCNLVSPVA